MITGRRILRSAENIHMRGDIYDRTAGICDNCREKNEKGKCTKAIPQMRKCFQIVPANCDVLTAKLERI